MENYVRDVRRYNNDFFLSFFLSLYFTLIIKLVHNWLHAQANRFHLKLGACRPFSTFPIYTSTSIGTAPSELQTTVVTQQQSQELNCPSPFFFPFQMRHTFLLLWATVLIKDAFALPSVFIERRQSGQTPAGSVTPELEPEPQQRLLDLFNEALLPRASAFDQAASLLSANSSLSDVYVCVNAVNCARTCSTQFACFADVYPISVGP